MGVLGRERQRERQRMNTSTRNMAGDAETEDRRQVKGTRTDGLEECI